MTSHVSDAMKSQLLSWAAVQDFRAFVDKLQSDQLTLRLPDQALLAALESCVAEGLRTLAGFQVAKYNPEFVQAVVGCEPKDVSEVEHKYITSENLLYWAFISAARFDNPDAESAVPKSLVDDWCLRLFGRRYPHRMTMKGDPNDDGLRAERAASRPTHEEAEKVQ